METIYLYNGALLDEDGECAMPIPHLFHSLDDARVWAAEQDLGIRIVKGVRRGDRLHDARLVKPSSEFHSGWAERPMHTGL
jgi:hypothetical protein